jgi:putative lipoprotein
LAARWVFGFWTVVALLATTVPVWGQEADPWFGRDKALHFSASASIAIVGYAGASLTTEHRPTRVAAATIVALGAGIGKELWDLGGPGDASWRDLTWDVIGTATGVLVASGMDWLIRHIRDPTPVAARP